MDFSAIYVSNNSLHIFQPHKKIFVIKGTFAIVAIAIVAIEVDFFVQVALIALIAVATIAI